MTSWTPKMYIFQRNLEAASFNASFFELARHSTICVSCVKFFWKFLLSFWSSTLFENVSSFQSLFQHQSNQFWINKCNCLTAWKLLLVVYLNVDIARNHSNFAWLQDYCKKIVLKNAVRRQNRYLPETLTNVSFLSTRCAAILEPWAYHNALKTEIQLIFAIALILGEATDGANGVIECKLPLVKWSW